MVSFGNVTNIFLKHNLGFSSKNNPLGLNVGFIKVQNSPGNNLYTSWSLGISSENSFWITNANCQKDNWCELSPNGRI